MKAFCVAFAVIRWQVHAKQEAAAFAAVGAGETVGACVGVSVVVKAVNSNQLRLNPAAVNLMAKTLCPPTKSTT